MNKNDKKFFCLFGFYENNLTQQECMTPLYLMLRDAVDEITVRQVEPHHAQLGPVQLYLGAYVQGLY